MSGVVLGLDVLLVDAASLYAVTLIADLLGPREAAAVAAELHLRAALRLRVRLGVAEEESESFRRKGL